MAPQKPKQNSETPGAGQKEGEQDPLPPPGAEMGSAGTVVDVDKRSSVIASPNAPCSLLINRCLLFAWVVLSVARAPTDLSPERDMNKAAHLWFTADGHLASLACVRWRRGGLRRCSQPHQKQAPVWRTDL
jgi:hypothetical protein